MTVEEWNGSDVVVSLSGNAAILRIDRKNITR
jgi:hypothetical protein